MEIFQQLGINHTVWIQFGLFIVSIWALQALVFRDFAAAAIERENRTKGSEEKATELTNKAQEIYKTYEEEARTLNKEIKNIFDSARTQAQSQVDAVLQKSRSRAQQLLEETRMKVRQDLLVAQKQLKEQVPVLAASVTQKLLATERYQQ